MPGLSGFVALDTASAVYALKSLKDAMQNLMSLGLRFDSTMEQASIGLTTALQGNSKAAQALLKDLKSLADASPLQQEDIAPYAQRLLAMQIPAKELTKDLRGIGEQTAALGASAATFKGISVALGQMELRGKVAQQEINQMTNQGVPAIKYLAQAWHVSTQEMQALIEKGIVPGRQAVQALAEQMAANNFGAMQKQALTLDGAISTLSDNFKSFVGGELKDTYVWLTNVINRMNVLAKDKQTTDYLHRVATNFKTAFSVAGEAVKWYWDIQNGIWQSEGQAIRWSAGLIADWAGKVWDGYKSVVKGAAWLADEVTYYLQRGFGGSGTYFQDDAAAGIAAHEKMFADLKKSATDFAKDVGTAWTETWGNMPDWGAKWEEAGKKVEEAKKKLSGSAPTTHSFAGQFLSDGKAARDALKSLLEEQKKDLAELARHYDTFSNFALDMYQKVGAFGERTESSALQVKLLSKDLQDISPAARSGAEGLARIVDQMKRISDLRDVVSQLLKGFEGRVIESHGEQLQRFYGQVKQIEAFMNVPNRMKSLFDKAGGVFGNIQAEVTAQVNSIHAKELIIEGQVKGLGSAGTPGAGSAPGAGNWPGNGNATPPSATAPHAGLMPTSRGVGSFGAREAASMSGGFPAPVFPSVATVLGFKQVPQVAPADASKMAPTGTDGAATGKAGAVDWSKQVPPDFFKSFTAYLGNAIKGLPAPTEYNENRRDALKTFGSVDWARATKGVSAEDRKYLEALVYAAANTADLSKVSDAAAQATKDTTEFGKAQARANDVLNQANTYIRTYGFNTLEAGKQEDILRFKIGLQNDEQLRKLDTSTRDAEITKRAADYERSLNLELRSTAWREHLGRVRDAEQALAALNDETIQSIAKTQLRNREDYNLLTPLERQKELLAQINLELGKIDHEHVIKVRGLADARELLMNAKQLTQNGDLSGRDLDEAIQYRNDLQTRYTELTRQGVDTFKAFAMAQREAFDASQNRILEARIGDIRSYNDLLKDTAQAVKLAQGQKDIILATPNDTATQERQLAIWGESIRLLGEYDKVKDTQSPGDFNLYGKLKAFTDNYDAQQAVKLAQEYTSLTSQAAQAMGTFGDMTATAGIKWRTTWGDLASLPADVKKGWVEATAQLAQVTAATDALNAAQQQHNDLQKQLSEGHLQWSGHLNDLQKQNLDWQFQDALNAIKNPLPIPQSQLDNINKERDAIRALLKDWMAFNQKGNFAGSALDAISGAFGQSFQSVLDRQQSFLASLRANLQSALSQMAADILKSQLQRALTSLFGGLFGISGKAIVPTVAQAAGVPSTVPAAPKVDGSHRAGLDFVPKDNYIGQLHLGEAVLNARDAAQWREMRAMQADLTRQSQSGRLMAGATQVGAAQMGSSAGMGTIVVNNFHGDIVTRDGSDFPRQVERATRSQGSRNRVSRGEMARKARLIVLGGKIS